MTTPYRAGAAAAIVLFALMPGLPVAAQDLINPDRPGIADGSRVIDPGQFQIETGFQRETHGDIHTDYVPTLARVGATRHLEVRVEGNTFTREAGVSGLAPTSLGLKCLLVDSREGPTVGLIARVFPPSGSSDFRTEHFTSDVRLAADIPLGHKASLNPNAGIARYEAGGRTYGAGLFALTLNYDPTERLNPFVDIGVQTSTGQGSAAMAALDAGVAYIIGEDLQLDIGVGQGVSGDAPRPFAAAGISIRLRRRR